MTLPSSISYELIQIKLMIKEIGNIWIKHQLSDLSIKLDVSYIFHFPDPYFKFFNTLDFYPSFYFIKVADDALTNMIPNTAFSLRVHTLQHILHGLRKQLGSGTIIAISPEFRAVLDAEPFDDTYKEPLWQSTLTQA
jgi:hypothetical protein